MIASSKPKASTSTCETIATQMLVQKLRIISGNESAQAPAVKKVFAIPPSLAKAMSRKTFMCHFSGA